MEKRLWVARSKTSTDNPFGRKMIGYCGWHDSQTSALKEAIKRYPDWPAEDIQVSQV